MAFHGNANVQLDLGNVVGPLVKTALRLLDNDNAEANEAIRRSGSDELTELKLAALLGRLRIDDVVKTNFRAIVASSNHVTISRFVQDLVLESGAGPTIQQALSSSNPALLSMAIQVSFLAFGHEHQSLAEAITQAIEETLVLSDNPRHRGLDYVSVVGLITVCQQQTAKFGWSYVYESMEAKILQSIKEWREIPQQAKKRRTTSTSAPELPATVAERGLPYVVLKSLLIHLISVQDFPEHRILQLSTHRGIGSIIVWCHYILGLSVKVACGKVETLFGAEPYHIYVKECDISQTSASLLEKVEEGEPIFTFSKSENDPPIESEYRLEARGFGRKALLRTGVSPEETTECGHLLAAGCIKHFSVKNLDSDVGQLKVTTMDTYIRENIISATLFLFDIAELDKKRMQKLLAPQGKKAKQLSERIKWQSYAVLVYLFARIGDLDTCGSVPLSLTAFRELRKEDHGISRSGDSFAGPLPDILLSYDLIARLLLGRRYSKNSMEKTFLVSGYGWSLFFDSSDAVDPADVTTGLLHLRPGVPTRLGIRRTRIVDGPTDVQLTSTKGVVLNGGNPVIAFWPGVSSGRYIGSYIGNYGTNAFSVVQHFEWALEDKKPKSWKWGFREKLETCMGFGILGPCQCSEEKTAQEDQAWIDSYLSSKDDERDVSVLCKYPAEGISAKTNISPERIFCKRTQANRGGISADTWFFFISISGSARWLALDGMDDLRLHETSDYTRLLRARDCCISCAVNQVTTRSLVLL